ncbi:MAG: VWA domain-containing protein [Fusobacteriaceae bacterium]
MEFGNLNYILWFLIPGIFIPIFFLGMRKKNWILKELEILQKKDYDYLKALFYFLGLVSLVVSLLSPEKEIESQTREIKGLDIYFLIDTSNSMRVGDVYPNRLDAGKRVINSVIDGLKADRVGFIPFSDSAYIQMPLTEDYKMAKNYLSAIDNNLISGGGTELLSALELGEKSFKDAQVKDKIFVIISDGGDYEKKVVDYVKNNDLEVYSFGIGTLSGGTIPKEEKGISLGFIKDDSGKTVVSGLNNGLLKSISNLGYTQIDNLSDNTGKFFQSIENLNRDTSRKSKIKSYKKYYQYPLLLGFIFILLGYFIKVGVIYENKK